MLTKSVCKNDKIIKLARKYISKAVTEILTIKGKEIMM